MSAGARAHHLISKPHAATVKKRKYKRERERKKIIDALRKRETAEVGAKRNEWTCPICIRSMNWASRESHLAGALHEDVLKRKRSNAGSACNNDATGPHALWTCEVCARTMSIISKDTHLSGRSHARSFAEKNNKLRQLEDLELRQLKQEVQMHYWTCDICIVSMVCTSRNEHLSGKRHRRVARNREETRYRGIMAVRKDERPLRGVRALDEMEKLERWWSCGVCCYTMDCGYRDRHLLSKMHARSVKKHEETMARELKREAQNRKWKEEQLKLEQLKRQWTCDVCNLSMHSVYRDAHLISRRHTHFVRQREEKVARELKREAQIRKRREEQLERQWTCDICDRSMDRICRDAHLFSRRHTRNVREHEKAVDRGLKREAQDRTRREEQLERQWTCDVCRRTMDSNCRNVHLFGKRHARVVRKREAVKA
jgi:hypothetical protein